MAVTNKRNITIKWFWFCPEAGSDSFPNQMEGRFIQNKQTSETEAKETEDWSSTLPRAPNGKTGLKLKPKLHCD